MGELTVQELKKNIGEKIKFYRKKINMSQFELSEKINIEMKSLSRIESGNNYPQCENLIAISNALKIHPWQLYFIDERSPIDEMKNEILNAIKSENEKIIAALYQYLKLM